MTPAPDDPKGSGAELTVPPLDFLTKEAEAIPPPERPKPTYELQSFDDLLALPEVEWIVQDFIKSGDLCMFFGAAGSGKTFATIDLLLGLVKGEGFYADRLGILKPCRVLYLSTEGRARIPARFRAAAAKHGIRPSPEQFRVITNDMPNLGEWGTLATFLGDLEASGFIPDLIVYDTFARITAGQEENPSDAAKLHVLNLEKVRDYLLSRGSDAVQIFLHHEARATGKARGSTVYEGAADLILRFREEKSEKRHVMSFEKSKDADPLEEQFFTLTTHDQGSAYVSWGGAYVKSANGGKRLSPVQKQAEEAFLNHASGPGKAKTLAGIASAAGGGESLRKALARLVADQKERFGSVLRETYGPGSVKNRAALHYWLKSNDEEE